MLAQGSERPKSKLRDIEFSIRKLGQVIYGLSKGHYTFKKMFRLAQANNNINEVEPLTNSYDELSQISDRVGIVSVGIDNIDDVSTPIISSKSEICPICIQEENNLRLTLCNHTFCDLCLQKWLKDNNKCPICMQNLLDLLNDKDE